MPDLSQLIDQGRGVAPADIVLRGGKVFCLITGELLDGDVAICGDTIVGICDDYEGRQVIDVTGQILVPGFIDTHLHIESSMVTPFEFDRCVLPRGVTTAICDPHEIANVIGPDGIGYFQDAAMRTLMDIRVQLSSCVPSTDMETSGAEILADDLRPLMGHPQGIGLAEFMNYPGVLFKDPDALAKLELFRGGHIDGHCPQLSGRDLNGYIAAGIRTEHEATTADEAREKLRKGMRVLIREGSVSKDLHALAEVLDERTAPYMCLCTDDRNPLDIAEHGHLDYMIRELIRLGVPALAVYRAASLSGAEAFGLKDRGQIAPGKAPRVTPEDFRSPANSSTTDVIGIIEGKIITEHLHEDIVIEDGDKRPDPARDLIRIAVVERHGKNGNIATGFVRGFGLQRGAIASTVCHDHHNIAVVGADYADMALAANRLSDIEGGFVVAMGGKVLAECPLPVAGLMSLAPFEEVHAQLSALREASKSLGVTLEVPFLQLAFLALPVIPALKITDRGLVDVVKFEIIP